MTIGCQFTTVVYHQISFYSELKSIEYRGLSIFSFPDYRRRHLILDPFGSTHSSTYGNRTQDLTYPCGRVKYALAQLPAAILCVWVWVVGGWWWCSGFMGSLASHSDLHAAPLDELGLSLVTIQSAQAKRRTKNAHSRNSSQLRNHGDLLCLFAVLRV